MTGPGLDGPAVTVDRAGDMLGCSRRQVFVLLAADRLERAQSAGRQTMIVTQSVIDFLLNPPAAKPKRRRRGGRQTLEDLRAAWDRGAGSSG